MTTRTFEELKDAVNNATRNSDAASLMECAEELHAMATAEAEAIAHTARGLVFYLRGDYPAALEHYHRALAMHEELGDNSGVARVTGHIGSVQERHGDYPEALSHFHRALAHHEEVGDRNSVASVTCNIGIVHWSTGDYPEALSHFHRALALYEELGNRSGVAGVTNNIGNVHANTGDHAEALSHFHRALTLHEELNDLKIVASVTGNIGNLHQSAGDYPEALSHYQRALELLDVHGDRSDVALVTGNLVGAYLKMGLDREALELFVAMDAMQIGEPDVRVEREHRRATLQERSGDLKGAAATLQLALTDALDHSLRSQAADTHKALRDLALKRNNLADYVEHNNEYTRITEEINGKETATRLAMQEAQKEIAKQRNEHDKHLAILHSTLPKHIADRIARGETVNDHFDHTAVLFIDVVGFTTNSSEMDAGTVVDLLQGIFTTFDTICAEHNVTKIKTIGDSYMAVAFSSDHHVADIASVAQAMTKSPFTWPHTGERVMFRVGLHCGPVVAGVLGTERMQYDVWGDTVNVASRMESTSEPGKIHISEALNEALKRALYKAHIVPRGEIEVKGKGMMKTYWLE